MDTILEFFVQEVCIGCKSMLRERFATGTMEDEAFAYDEEKALSANGFSREGHTFEAWNSKDDGSGDAYEDGALVKNLVETNKGSITLFAQWSVNEYTITFVNEGGTELQSEKVAFGDTPTYKGDEPTKLKLPTIEEGEPSSSAPLLYARVNSVLPKKDGSTLRTQVEVRRIELRSKAAPWQVSPGSVVD